jgi:GT2 family glycosyltransferase
VEERASLRICALIVTRHRTEQLKCCLRSLLASSARAPGIELRIRVLLDEKDRQSLELLSREFPLVSFEKSEDTQGRALGPARGRNRLFERSLADEYDWAFFVDDDASVENSFFNLFSEIVRTDPSACVIGGPNLTPEGSNLFQQATGEALACRFGNFLSTARYRQAGSLRPSSERELILCNLFVRRDWMSRVRFPETYVCAEENRVLQDLAELGAKILHEPRLFVFHERRAAPVSLSAQVFKYGRGRGQNLKDKPKTLRWPHVLPSLVLIMVLVLAASWGLGDRASGAVLGILAGGYALSCLAMAVRVGVRARQHARAGAWAIGGMSLAIFPILHFSYAAGVLRGLAER